MSKNNQDDPKKKHPKARQLRAAAQIMRKFAETFDQMAELMDDRKISEVFIDNWPTAMRGVGYVKNAAMTVSYEYMNHGVSQVVRELLDEYRSAELAADEIEDKKPAKKSRKRPE